MHPLCKVAMSQCFNLPVFVVPLTARFSHAHGVYVYLCRWMRLNAPAIRVAVIAFQPSVIPQWSAACTHPFIIIVCEYHPMDHEPIRIMHPTMLLFNGLHQISVGVPWTHRGVTTLWTWWGVGVMLQTYIVFLRPTIYGTGRDDQVGMCWWTVSAGMWAWK